MAADTVAGDALVAENDARKRRRIVAVVTATTGWNVAGAFTQGDSVVMAARTAAENLIVIDAGDNAPGRIVVAVFTAVGGSYVIVRFWRRTDGARLCVTNTALTWSTFEYTLYVTGFAFNLAVRSPQRKPSGEMIETA